MANIFKVRYSIHRAFYAGVVVFIGGAMRRNVKRECFLVEWAGTRKMIVKGD